MRRYVTTPAGALGAICVVLLLALSTVLWRWDVADSRRDARTACMIGESVQPWVGLRETFKAPPGDPVARAKALDAINAGIDRAENLDAYC